jgi:hypothetical protein
MSFRFLYRLRLAAAVPIALASAAPAPAYLYWSQPSLKGAPVNGDEPGIALPLPGATPKEVKAAMLWTMRAGLNVAALQCQFAPGLMTVGNYNAVIRQHSAELQDSYKVVQNYFKRTGDKKWQSDADSYTTKTYNGFSTLHAQLSFCETAASIGREAVTIRMGHLTDLAGERMREFRNSLVPIGDPWLGTTPRQVDAGTPPDLLCYDRKGRQIACKFPKTRG